MRVRSHFPRAAVVVATALIARSASASPSFPSILRDELSLRYLPDCSICHGDTGQADGRVVTDFGVSMEALGMKGSDVESLRVAIRANRDLHWDSDGDGIPDAEELARGLDPNGLALSRTAGPEYGCSVAARPPGVGLAWVGPLVYWILRRGQRSRRRSSQS